MTARAAGGRRTGCATPSRREQQQQQQQQQQQHSSSEASIRAGVGCDRVSCGVVRDAVAFKNFFDRAIRCAYAVEKVGSAHPVEKVLPFPRHVRIGLLDRKNWGCKGTFSTA